MIIPMRSFFRKDLILFSIHTQLLGLIHYMVHAKGKPAVDYQFLDNYKRGTKSYEKYN